MLVRYRERSVRVFPRILGILVPPLVGGDVIIGIEPVSSVERKADVSFLVEQ